MQIVMPEDMPEYMSIEAQPGDPVIFKAEGGYAIEKENAARVLTVGETYTVAHIEVGSASSRVTLVGIPGSFNTCLFAPGEVPDAAPGMS